MLLLEELEANVRRSVLVLWPRQGRRVLGDLKKVNFCSLFGSIPEGSGRLCVHSVGSSVVA